MRSRSSLILIFVFGVIDISPAMLASSSELVLRVPSQSSNSTTTTTSLGLNLDPNSPWEEFIMPSPTVIALLGQLMVISGKIDFSLVENRPSSGFKYMRHPESFRASLVQVSNDGWSAFMNAHKNMDRIQLYMQQIPQQVKTTIKILSNTGASTSVVQRLLPITLNRIQEIGRTCVQLSAETESKFADVMLLLGELLEVTESSRGTHHQKLAQVQIELNVTAERRKMIERLGEELKKRQDTIDAEVNKRRSQYDDAMSKIPTGWRAIAQDLGRAVVNVVNFVPQMVMSKNAGGGGSSSGGGSGASTNQSGDQSDFQRSSTLGLFRNFFDSLTRMKNAVVEVLQGKRQSADRDPTQLLPTIKVLLDEFEKGFQSSPSDLTRAAVEFINEARTLLNGDLKTQLDRFLSLNGAVDENNSTALDTRSTNPSQIASAFDAILDRMKQLDARASASSSSSSSSGGQSSAAPSGGGDSRLSCTGCNERYKANLALAALQHAEQRQDQIFGDMMKYHEEMKQLVGSMARLNLTEISYKEILELLTRGIDLLAKIRVQWGRLVEFFSLVSVRAEVALNQTLGPFLDYARQAESMVGELGKEDRRFYLELLSEQAIEINRVSYFLYTLSSTYFDMSTRFLMDRMAGLARMLAVDSEPERERLLAHLWTEANQTQDAIKLMAQERRQQSVRLIQGRKRELQEIVDRLGPPNEIEAEAIRSAYEPM